MNHVLKTIVLACVLAAFLPGCKKSETQTPAKSESTPATTEKATPDSHVHADGTTHVDSGNATEEDHSHGDDEVPLGTAAIGDAKVEFSQGHGKVEAGKEGHLVVKLPYNDRGATIIRAWIGTEDRLQSVVGKGEYAPSHDDYDVHAVAPDPLPQNAMWWVEIQKPDGSKSVGSIRPLMD